jgi:hypothetical protein
VVLVLVLVVTLPSVLWAGGACIYLPGAWQEVCAAVVPASGVCGGWDVSTLLVLLGLLPLSFP